MDVDQAEELGLCLRQFGWWLYMIIVPLSLIISTSIVRPPMHRAWTALTGDYTDVCAIKKGVLYYRSLRSVGALELATGKLRWSRKVRGYSQGATSGTTQIFVVDGRGETSELVAFNLATGSRRRVASLPKDTSKIACDEKRLFVLLPSGSVEALNQRNGQVLWKRGLGGGRIENYSSALAYGHGCLVVGTGQLGVSCLEPGTGAVRWTDPTKGFNGSAPAFLSQGILSIYDGLKMRKYATGKAIWSFDTGRFDLLAVSGNVLIGKNEGQLVGLDATSGHELWRGETAKSDERSFGNREMLAPSDGGGAIITDQSVMRVSNGGKIEWSVKPFFDGTPVYADSKLLLCSDGQRLLGYAAGPIVELPKDSGKRRARASQMVADFESLDSKEMDQVVALAPYATAPLLRKYVSWAIDNR